MREAEVAREIEPYVGYVASLVAGVVALGASFWLCTRLPMPEDIASPWLVPVALFSIFAGLFLIVSRKRAVNQVLGFLVLENGIYTFGVGVAVRNAVPGRSWACCWTCLWRCSSWASPFSTSTASSTTSKPTGWIG